VSHDVRPIRSKVKREVSLSGLPLSPKLAEKEDLPTQLKPEINMGIIPKEEHLRTIEEHHWQC
jgi:hypothetical protein